LRWRVASIPRLSWSASCSAAASAYLLSPWLMIAFLRNGPTRN